MYVLYTITLKGTHKGYPYTIMAFLKYFFNHKKGSTRFRAFRVFRGLCSFQAITSDSTYTAAIDTTPWMSVAAV